MSRFGTTSGTSISCRRRGSLAFRCDQTVNHSIPLAAPLKGLSPIDWHDPRSHGSREAPLRSCTVCRMTRHSDIGGEAQFDGKRATRGFAPVNASPKSFWDRMPFMARVPVSSRPSTGWSYGYTYPRRAGRIIITTNLGARNCSARIASGGILHDWQYHLALPDPGETWWRRNGCCVQGRGH